MIVYTVHDVVADTWSYPQVSPTKASAVRDFGELRRRPNVPGADLECVLIGQWYPDKGDILAQGREILVPVDSRANQGDDNVV